MMVDYLKIHFAETIADNMEEGFKMKIALEMYEEIIPNK